MIMLGKQSFKIHCVGVQWLIWDQNYFCSKRFFCIHVCFFLSHLKKCLKTYLFRWPHEPVMQRNVCWHLGVPLPLLSLRALLLSLTIFEKRLKRRCSHGTGHVGKGWWLTLALTLFMKWPSVSLETLNSLAHSRGFCLSTILDHVQLCKTAKIGATFSCWYNFIYLTTHERQDLRS